jgi:hypothetical protein
MSVRDIPARPYRVNLPDYMCVIPETWAINTHG